MSKTGSKKKANAVFDEKCVFYKKNEIYEWHLKWINVDL